MRQNRRPASAHPGALTEESGRAWLGRLERGPFLASFVLFTAVGRAQLGSESLSWAVGPAVVGSAAMERTRPSASANAAVPSRVQQLVAAHLAQVDQAAPGLIEMLYLTGSVTLGDYWPGVSDVDFLAVTSRTLDAGDLAAVAAAHEGMPAPSRYDGIYLERSALATTPDDCPVVPHIVNGVFRTDQRCGELNPVLWLMLTRYGIAMRGPATADLDVRVDPQRLRRWNLDNLRSYWQPLAERIRQKVAGRAAAEIADPDAVMWAVLGPARLHYTLATGEVTSKTGAAQYAAQQFPAWAALAAQAVACRAGQPVEFVTVDALATAAMVDAVVEDAWRRWG